MDTETRTRVIEIVACELETATINVRSGVSLRKDLGMDSVAALNILFAAEEALDIRIPEGELEKVDDLDAILALIERHSGGVAAAASAAAAAAAHPGA